ncbi:MAG: DUF4147 domain-containing protein [bacterium]
MKDFYFDYNNLIKNCIDFKKFSFHADPEDTALISTGKSAVPMYEVFLENFPHMKKSPALCIFPEKSEIGKTLKNKNRKIEIVPSSHPEMSSKSIYAGKKLINFVNKHKKRRRFINLVSGGSSALVEYSKNPAKTIRKNHQLLYSGKNIREINLERIKNSLIKGGKLTEYAPKALWISFVMNDIPFPQGYRMVGSMPFFKPGNPRHKIFNMCDSKNFHEKGKAFLESKGFFVAKNFHYFTASSESAYKTLLEALLNLSSGEALLCSGEITVKIDRNPGYGGRLSHLSLMFLPEIKKHCYYFAALSSDGIDGNSENAGIELTSSILKKNYSDSFRKECLKTYNSYSFFEKYGGIKKTSYTAVNINDLIMFCKH